MSEASTQHTACPICAKTHCRAWGTHGRYHLVKCQACSFIYVRERVAADFYATFYQAQASDPRAVYDAATVEKFARMLHEIRALGLSDLRALDVGCGNGIFLSVAAEAGFDALGIDTDKARVTGCVARGFRAVCGCLPQPDIKPESVDLVWCSHIIEHIDKPHEFLDAVEKPLKPGGVIVLLTPNIGGLAGRVCGRHFRKVIPPEHLSYYAPASLRALAHKRGWHEERVYTRDAAWTLKEIMAYILKAKFLRDPIPLTGTQPFSVEHSADNSPAKQMPPRHSPGMTARISHAFAPIMAWFGGDELIGIFRKPETSA